MSSDSMGFGHFFVPRPGPLYPKEFLVERLSMEMIGLVVADHVSAMLAYWDKDLVCRFANAAYQDWFGKTREEMVGKITIKELLGPLYEKNLPYILGVLEGTPQTFEREIPVPGGHTRHSLANYFPDIVNGEVRGFFVHVADITHTKVLEKKLIQSHEIISEQNKRLLNFANIVSHNLRSYASNLKSILDLFMAAGTDSEKDIMLKYLQSISKGFSTTVDHLSQIVETQNQKELKMEPINLHDYVAQTIDVTRAQLTSTGSLVHNNVDKSLTLLANPAYIESILLNLLTNAIKYRKADQPLIVQVDAKIKPEEIMLVVKDNGRGINLERHKNDIFGMYKTFHQNPDAKGIGLFITKMQVEAMNGRVEVESEEQLGTSFIIHFPIQEN